MKKATTPENSTINQLAELANLTPRRVYQLCQEKKLPPVQQGRIPMLDGIRQLFLWFARDGENLQREKLRLATAARKLAEMKAEEAEASQNRTWTLTIDVVRMFQAIVARMEQMPGRAKSEAGLSDAQSATLQKLLDETRCQIARDIENMKPQKGKEAA